MSYYQTEQEYSSEATTYKGFNRGATFAAETIRIETKDIRAFVGKGARTVALPDDMISTATGKQFWNCPSASYKLSNGNMMALFIEEDGMPELAPNANANYITVCPSAPPVGFASMCLWPCGTEGPYVGLPNGFEYPLGDVFTVYHRKGEFPFICPKDESIRDYTVRAMSAWEPAEQFRLVNYGKINIPAKRRVGVALETDVWVTYTWFEFEPI